MRRFWMLLWSAMALVLQGCAEPEIPVGDYQRPTALDPLRVAPSVMLAQHSKEFARGIYQVADGVHVAVGYGIANSILIIGEGGNIVVDALEDADTARQVRAEFDRISGQPLAAIIYTHNHGDHVFGAGGMAGRDQPMVIAQEQTAALINRVVGMLNPILGVRSRRMFGSLLIGPALENVGIGPALNIEPDSDLHMLAPTLTFRDRLELEVAGVKLLLVHAPGETDDQLFVYLPERGVLMPGDNFYRAFPNLYTIRGTPYRDLDAWVASLDAMRALKPQFLVPSHSRPLSGAGHIEQQLLLYRDAIQFVHDQTVRAINTGRTPDAWAQAIELPQPLQDSPWLTEFYGKVSWSARSVFSGYLGWFDGNPTRLQPLPPTARAERLQKLAGGAGRLLASARTAWVERDYQWLLELTDALLALESNHEEARLLRRNALVRLGAAESNPNARHYYLMSALELANDEAGTLLPPSESLLDRISLDTIFRIMRVRVNPEKAAGLALSLRFDFTDTGRSLRLALRNSILDVQPGRAESTSTIVLRTTEKAAKRILTGVDNPAVAAVSGDVSIDSGSSLDLIRFMRVFDAN